MMKTVSIVTTLIALLVMVSPASALPPYEQDDDPLHARSFRVNDDLQTKDFDKAGDEDWVVFPLINGQKYHIETDNLLPNVNPNINGTYIEVYDSSILDDPDAVPVYCDDSMGFDSRIQFDPDPFDGVTQDYYARVLFKWCWHKNDPDPPLDCGQATFNTDLCPDPEQSLSDYTYDFKVYDPDAPGATVGGYVYKGTPSSHTPIEGVVVTIAGVPSTATTATGHYSVEVPDTGTLPVYCATGQEGLVDDPYTDHWIVTGNMTKNIYFTPGQDPSPCGTLATSWRGTDRIDLNLTIPFLLLPLGALILLRVRGPRR